jgi:hypothetical protein
VSHDRLEETQIALQVSGGLVRQSDVQQNVLAVALFANRGRQSAFAPDIHFINVAASLADPALNQFVFTHWENLLSTGLLPFAPWAGWERKETQIVS